MSATDDVKHHAQKKENNPFSEQEKHGDEAQRRKPTQVHDNQDGTSSVQPHTDRSNTNGGTPESESKTG
jgi:hypothetical protein